MRQPTNVLAALLLSALVGCGTIANMRGETVVHFGGPFACQTRPFGGVVQDVNVVVGIPGGFLMIADLPFSFVGDLVTLPWTAFVTVRDQRHPTEMGGRTDSLSPPASGMSPVTPRPTPSSCTRPSTDPP